MIKKKTPLKKGCVFAIPLRSHRAAIGQVIYIDLASEAKGQEVSANESDCLYVNIRAGFVDVPTSPCDVDMAMKTPIIFKGFMRDIDIRRGKWLNMGEWAIPSDAEVEEVLQVTPEGFIVEDLERKFIRKATENDMHTLHYRRYRLSRQIGEEIRKKFDCRETE